MNLSQSYEKNRQRMTLWILGLTKYAAHRGQEFGIEAEKENLSQLRSLIMDIAWYWRLDNDSEKQAADQFLEPFDRLTSMPGSISEIDGRTKSETVVGLLLHAQEKLHTQGTDAQEEILEAKRLAEEVADFWDFDSPLLQHLCTELESDLAGQIARESQAMGGMQL